MNIGLNIKRLRELKNLTRETVAADLGLSLSGYGKIERNEVDLTLSRIKQIAHVIGVELEHILNFSETHILSYGKPEGLIDLAINSSSEDYKDKYIRMLEDELERIKNLLNGAQ